MDKLTIEEYKTITARAHGKVAKFFKPKESLAIIDFIETVTQADIDPEPVEAAEEEAAAESARRV